MPETPCQALTADARRDALRVAEGGSPHRAFLLEKDTWVVAALHTLLDAPFGKDLAFVGKVADIVKYLRHMTNFGPTIRGIRERLRRDDRRYSVRQVAQRVGIEPAYLSKIERGEVAPPSEATTVRLARELYEDPDVMLALAGKVSTDLQAIIRRRPRLFADLIRQLKEAPDEAVQRLAREVRDGKW